MRLAFCRGISTVAAVTAITVAVAALAWLALMAIVRALFLAVRTRLGVLRRSRHQRVAGLIRACDHAGMCCIKAVGLYTCCWCSIAVVTALIAAATAFATVTAWFTALTTFTPALAFSPGLTLSVAPGVLHGALLALRCFTFVHGRSHGRLVRQCQILLHRIAGRAVGAFAAL